MLTGWLRFAIQLTLAVMTNVMICLFYVDLFTIIIHKLLRLSHVMTIRHYSNWCNVHKLHKSVNVTQSVLLSVWVAEGEQKNNRQNLFDLYGDPEGRRENSYESFRGAPET